MLYLGFVAMIILGACDGLFKLNTNSCKNTKEYNNILDFLLSK